MVQFDIEVLNRTGIHTRPAAMIVKTTTKYYSDIFMERNGFKVNAKSIIGVMTIAAEQGTKLKFHIEGKDENDAANEIKSLFNSGFGEMK